MKHYSISKETSDKYIHAWKNGGYSIIPSSQTPFENQLQLDSFVFSIEDFIRFVERVKNDPSCDDITGVVCRIGIKDNPIANDKPTKVPCLIFEAVEGFSAGPPVIPGTCKGDLKPLAGESGSTAGEKTSARYDLSYPCPPTCPQS